MSWLLGTWLAAMAVRLGYVLWSIEHLPPDAVLRVELRHGDHGHAVREGMRGLLQTRRALRRRPWLASLALVIDSALWPALLVQTGTRWLLGRRRGHSTRSRDRGGPRGPRGGCE